MRTQLLVTFHAIACAAIVASAHAGLTTPISHGPNGPANGGMRPVACSADGNRVLILGSATNLAASDTDFEQDAFVRDIGADTLTHVSIPPAGVSFGPLTRVDTATMSRDGSTVVFTTIFPADLWLHDLTTGTTQLLVDGGPNPLAFSTPSISDDGRLVLFGTSLTHLDPIDPTPDVDAYVFDTSTHTVAFAALDGAGTEVPGETHAQRISGDGRFITFGTQAPVLPGDVLGIDIVRRDLITGAVTAAHPKRSGATSTVMVSAMSTDGNLILLESNEIKFPGLVVFDANAGTFQTVTNELASEVPNPTISRSAMSGDGRWVEYRWRLSYGLNYRIELKDQLLSRVHVVNWVLNYGAVKQATVGGVSDSGTRTFFQASGDWPAAGIANGLANAYRHDVRAVIDLGLGLGGSGGAPKLVAIGANDIGAPATFTLSNAPASTLSCLCFVQLTMNTSPKPAPGFGGTLAEAQFFKFFFIPTDATGGWTLSTTIPMYTQTSNLVLQTAILDPTAPAGVALSNALVIALF